MKIKNYTDMKNINLKLIGIVIVLSISLLGCKKDWIDPEINVDPNQPSDVPMKYLVPSIQASMGYVIGGNTAVRTSNIWMQFFDGVDRQSLAEARYNLTSADVNDLWENLYAQAMMDCNDLIIKAGEKNSPHYAGVAKVCMASCLGTLTNLFGDMPYTEAFKGGSGVLQPAYESQEAIYGYIDNLLAEAVTDFGAENAVDLESDLIYNGDVALWTKAAYALRARYKLYLGEYSDALGYTEKAFAANSEDFQVPFENSTAGANPIYQFMRDRTDIRMSSTFVDDLTDTQDPRLPFYAELDLAGGYSGSVPGSENSAASFPGTYVAAADAPVQLANYTEMKFIKAECLHQTGKIDGALIAYKEAITQSLLKVTGELDSTYMADHVDNETTGSITLQKIIEQKYNALYGTVIPYDDWRRTGFPALAPVDGATKATPVRYPYPQSEIAYNQNTPVGVNLSDKLWIFK